MVPRLLFLCPHNAAKSVLAAAYMRQRAAEQALDLYITTAGTEPDAEVSQAVVALLREEGIDVAGERPRLVTREELVAADYVVSLGCDLNAPVFEGITIQQWDDVPPPSQDLGGARALILDHIDQLLGQLTQATSLPPSTDRGGQF